MSELAYKSHEFLTLTRAMLLFLVLTVADMVTTTIGVLYLHINEGNPLLVDRAGNFIWWRMFAMKALVLLGVYGGLFILHNIRHRRMAYYVAAIAINAVMLLVVASNIVSILITLHLA